MHIGSDVTVRLSEVIAILDRHRAGNAPATRDYLALAKAEKRLGKLPEGTKSLVITDAAIYTSPISSVTLARRAANREVL